MLKQRPKERITAFSRSFRYTFTWITIFLSCDIFARAHTLAFAFTLTMNDGVSIVIFFFFFLCVQFILFDRRHTNEKRKKWRKRNKIIVESSRTTKIAQGQFTVRSSNNELRFCCSIASLPFAIGFVVAACSLRDLSTSKNSFHSLPTIDFRFIDELIRSIRDQLIARSTCFSRELTHFLSPWALHLVEWQLQFSFIFLCSLAKYDDDAIDVLEFPVHQSRWCHPFNESAFALCSNNNKSPMRVFVQRLSLLL